MKKHEDTHIIQPVYLPKNKLALVRAYLKSINITFSKWIREKINELIEQQNLK